ncbi:hypothetical protein OF83DRAFT_1069115 [Amylostereum chailletii]|nr:hypothetical protein OF83DRAFT_1069115 [Amylostereum chailletii]
MIGLAQPCDVGIQRPYKLSIKKSQLNDIVRETLDHLEQDKDPETFRLDTCIKTLWDRSVSWFVNAWEDINKPELVKKVNGFDLSFESLTSPAALKILCNLNHTDPELWAKECPFEEDELSDVNNLEVNHNSPDEDLFDDSMYEPADLMARLLAPDSAGPPALGLAETLDPGEVIIPDPAAIGWGKRRKTANSVYKDFVMH